MLLFVSVLGRVIKRGRIGEREGKVVYTVIVHVHSLRVEYRDDNQSTGSRASLITVRQERREARSKS
jgi:hypothetical protein